MTKPKTTTKPKTKPAKKPTVVKPEPELEIEAEPEIDIEPEEPIELVGEFQITQGPLVIMDLQTIVERWAGRPAHPACIYVEGPEEDLAVIKHSMKRFDIEILKDGNWRIQQANRIVADHNLGQIRAFIQQTGVNLKASILGAKTGPAIAIHEARSGVGVYNERHFNLCGIQVAADSIVTVERQGKKVILTIG